MGFRYSVLCETPSNAVDAVRSASPLGFQILKVKTDRIPLALILFLKFETLSLGKSCVKGTPPILTAAAVACNILA
jgi:hypothetical protein